LEIIFFFGGVIKQSKSAKEVSNQSYVNLEKIEKKYFHPKFSKLLGKVPYVCKKFRFCPVDLVLMRPYDIDNIFAKKYLKILVKRPKDQSSKIYNSKL